METPKELKVGGFVYKIVPITPESKETASGICHRDIKVIEIDFDLLPVDVADTAIHEALHAIFYERGLYHILGYENEEHIVSQFATGLVEIIRRNPKFFLWCMANATARTR